MDSDCQRPSGVQPIKICEASSHSVKGLNLDTAEHRTVFIRNFYRVAGEIMYCARICSG